MTRDDAAVLANEAAGPGRSVDPTRVREIREGYYFPYRYEGEGRLGPNGLIVNKRTGACFLLGSAFSVERDLVAYDEGFQFDGYDLTILSIHDLERSLDAIEEIGPSIVEPEFAHGTLWRIARRLTRAEIGERVARLPFTFANIGLYYRVEVLQEARRTGAFSFEAREHRR